MADCAAVGLRTDIPEARRARARVWTDRPATWDRAYRHNRRRVRGGRGKRLRKLRGEKVERTCAQVGETGGGRRSWWRGLHQVGKRYLMQVAGHNLGISLRRVFGTGTPRSLQGLRAAVVVYLLGWRGTRARSGLSGSATPGRVARGRLPERSSIATLYVAEKPTFSTGC